MSEEHGSLIKNTKQLSIAVIASFFIPLIIIFLLIVYVNSGKKTDTNGSERSTLAIIKPVGQLNFKDASAPREMQTGEAVYKAVCASCHNSGAAGALNLPQPQLGVGALERVMTLCMPQLLRAKERCQREGGQSKRYQ